MHTKPNWLAGTFAGLWLLIILIPVYVMVKASLQSQSDYGATGPLGLPTKLTVSNFQYSLQQGFGLFLINSGIVAIGAVLIILVLVPPLAFAIVRSQSRWVGLAFKIMLFGLAIPAQVVVIPVFFLINGIHLYDTLLGVIIPTAVFLIPLTTLILTGSMREIGSEQYEAMALDGASSFRTFRTLVLPLSRGGIATIVIFSALNAWNNYLLPLVLTRSQDVRVATLGLGIFQQMYSVNVPGLMSAIIMTVIPILLLYIFARRSLIRGLMGVGGK